MNRRRIGWERAAVLCLSVLACTSAVGVKAQAQTQSSTASFAWGMGYMPQTALGGPTSGASSFAMMPVPMVVSGTGTSTSAAGRAADPMGMGYVYGPAVIPMTPGQAGLSLLSTASRMSGIGNGQVSGVRPGAQPNPRTTRRQRGQAEPLADASHTRNSNIPGGQAARYFNRGTAPAAPRSQPYYYRNLRYFPNHGQ